MSAVTVAFLIGRLKLAEVRWDRAMRRPGYRDDPEDEQDIAQNGPWLEEHHTKWFWAHNWRLMVHEIENELDLLPEAAHIRAEQLSLRASEHTQYVSEMTPTTLAGATRELRGSDGGTSSPRAKRRR